MNQEVQQILQQKNQKCPSQGQRTNQQETTTAKRLIFIVVTVTIDLMTEVTGGHFTQLPLVSVVRPPLPPKLYFIPFFH